MIISFDNKEMQNNSFSFINITFKIFVLKISEYFSALFFVMFYTFCNVNVFMGKLVSLHQSQVLCGQGLS